MPYERKLSSYIGKQFYFVFEVQGKLVPVAIF